MIFFSLSLVLYDIVILYKIRRLLSPASGAYLVVGISDKAVTVKMPVSISAMVVVLGDNSPSVTSENSASATLDENGVAWN